MYTCFLQKSLVPFRIYVNVYDQIPEKYTGIPSVLDHSLYIIIQSKRKFDTFEINDVNIFSYRYRW